MKRDQWLRAGLMMLAGVPPAFGQVAGSATLLPKRLIADYGYWSQTDTPPYSAAQIPFNMLTHINHCCIGFGADGALSVHGGYLEPELITKAQANGVKVLILLSGDFRVLDLNPVGLHTLVLNLATFAAQNGYVGVDVDWESPSSATDSATFLMLMQALRDTFPSPNYLLSADVESGGGAGYDFEQTEPLVDYYNIMMYDCAGPWTSDGQLNSPIFPDPDNPVNAPGGSAAQAIDLFTTTWNVPVEKLNMGTPFYGYWYQNVTELWGNCNPCNDHTVVTESYGKFLKQRINQDGWRTLDDPYALVPYMLKEDSQPGFITYDDASSTSRRVSYSIWERGLGGSFMWALDQDYDGQSQDLLDAMYSATTNLPPPARPAP